MKQLFKKYFNSLLHPDEFSVFTIFLSKKSNDTEISNLMKPLWDNEIKNTPDNLRYNPSLLAKIKEIIIRDKYRHSQLRLKTYKIIAGIAAVLVIALLVSNILFYQKKGFNLYTAQLQTISTPYGAKTHITLPDGSRVWLNSGSTLSYPMHFSKKRPVSLTGEAFFKVTKSKIPFIVSTAYGKVEVKGTSFDVKAFKDDHEFAATLVEGSVEVRDNNDSHIVTIKPGEQATNTRQGFKVNKVDTTEFTSWKKGQLVFNKELFPELIKKLERWYNVKIINNDKKLDTLWYTGTIEMENISQVMTMISKATPIIYTYNNKTKEFTIRAK